MKYDRMAAGPADAISEPEPMNSPAPITPPSAIMVMCRCLRLCFKPLDCISLSSLIVGGI
ncbi:hypothetical protein N805_00335 [Pseudomonas putida S13.1.2]|uniref:Uncharacterized protein n=1 Tax=Pseudomonas putida S13.1.2 TaxID=1384061 RepID=A0AAU8RYZ4_PSEPU|nr:hypothetical protein N805_00335 [Pseudomonas putida S13.1.2]